jgi:hypothetical protein
MDAAVPEDNINAATKEEAEIYHTERIVDDERKGESVSLTRAQIRRFMIQQDTRVLPMLGVIYAVSILDRINVSSPLQDECQLTDNATDRICQSAGHGRGPQPW